MKKLKKDDVILHYKADAVSRFEPLFINERGRYTDVAGKQRSFPQGFFDVSVGQLLEIG